MSLWNLLVYFLVVLDHSSVNNVPKVLVDTSASSAQDCPEAIEGGVKTCEQGNINMVAT